MNKKALLFTLLLFLPAAYASNNLCFILNGGNICVNQTGIFRSSDNATFNFNASGITSVINTDTYLTILNGGGPTATINANTATFDLRYALLSSFNLLYTNVTNLQSSNTTTNIRIDGLNATKAATGSITNSTHCLQNVTLGNTSVSGQYTPCGSGGGGSGNVTSGNGTAGYLPFFTNSTNLNASLLNYSIIGNDSWLNINNGQRIGNVIKLQVNGVPGIAGGQAGLGLTDGSGVSELDFGAASTLAYMRTFTQHDLRIYAGNSVTNGFIQIKGNGSTTGFVGINTTTPTHSLHVLGSSNITGTVYTSELCLSTDCKTAWPSGGGNVTGQNLTNNYVPRATNSTNLVSGTIQDNGSNVLIGSGTPIMPLVLNVSGSPLYRGTSAHLLVQATNPGTFWEQSSTSDFGGIIVNNNRMRFLLMAGSGNIGTQHEKISIEDSTGYVGINTSTTTTISQQLHVQGNANITSVLYTPQICLNGDCQTAWPSGGSGGNMTQFNVSNGTVQSVVTNNSVVTIQAGSNIAVNQTGNTFTISTAGSAGGGSNTDYTSTVNYRALYDTAMEVSGITGTTATMGSYSVNTPSGCVFEVGNNTMLKFDRVIAKFSSGNASMNLSFMLYECTVNGTSCDQSELRLNISALQTGTTHIWENTTGNWTIGGNGTVNGSLGGPGYWLYFMKIGAVGTASIATISPYSGFTINDLGTVCKRTSNAGAQTLTAPGMGSIAPQIIVTNRWTNNGG